MRRVVDTTNASSSNAFTGRANQGPSAKPEIDLRPVSVTFAQSGSDSAELRAYRELRTECVRKYGWIDLRDGQEDHDVYDLPDRQTYSVLLHRGSERQLLAGIRITSPLSEDPMDSLSFQMWGDQRTEMQLDQTLKNLFRERRMIDTTRLLTTPEGTATHLLMTLGACLGRTHGNLGAFYTVERRAFLFLQRMTKIKIHVFHEGQLGDVRCVLGYIPPLGDVLTIPELEGGLIHAGANLAGSKSRTALFDGASSNLQNQ